jgi:hypothetical protein
MGKVVDDRIRRRSDGTVDSDQPDHGRALIAQIKRHSESVRSRTVVCRCTACRHCGKDVVSGEKAFTLHGCRSRRFLVLVGSYAFAVAALLARWRCPYCNRTFTEYPGFAEPYKAYTVPQMAERAANYVSCPRASYRDGVRFDNRSIFHTELLADGSLRHRCSGAIPIWAHSSLFRWVTGLASAVLRQAKPWHTDFAPAAHKYKSAPRRLVLMACKVTCAELLAGQASA